MQLFLPGMNDEAEALPSQLSSVPGEDQGVRCPCGCNEVTIGGLCMKTWTALTKCLKQSDQCYALH